MPDSAMQAEILKLALYWGPAILILYGLYKLLIKFGNTLKSIVSPFGERFIEAQQHQAAALTEQAAATRAFNQSFQDFISRDNNEHREMLIILKMIAQTTQSFEQVKKEHNETFNRATHCGGSSESSGL